MPDYRVPEIRNAATGLEFLVMIFAVRESLAGRLCCKSRFALMIKNSKGCRRDFRVSM
jgi:hypothetical protein